MKKLLLLIALLSIGFNSMTVTSNECSTICRNYPALTWNEENGTCICGSAK